jgi:hypothetical protein
MLSHKIQNPLKANDHQSHNQATNQHLFVIQMGEKRLSMLLFILKCITIILFPVASHYSMSIKILDNLQLTLQFAMHLQPLNI